ncbi:MULTISPECIES: S66 peptidase family protein [Pseudomonas]|uniref:S66 peptidase family protein n=2 Tax=Gammaproteobacteria TaxID=1236 RepID=UPI000287F9BE|nr:MULTISPECIES: LD-carboxypeptidase [Pseudomonas]AMB78108.1 LD-carboxypeptidase [Pseudomonas fragi]NNG63245.1 LD-carboxypeptidase [Pseudomonas sp. GC01]MCH4867974.1 LD-carboxypeptidase [Pseudomonas sp. TMW22089]NBG90996.1 LD-carboxypeptidase [Pseudomonas sp. 9.1(2019)]RUT32191.1 LD-carboxypeptidase [Pseudomonas sp. PAMC 29040]
MNSRLTAQVSYKAHSAVPALPAGGVIALIAPAGPAELDLELATQWMAARGYQLRVLPGVWEKDGYLAGSDAVRLRDLHDAFADESVDAIFCLRGGYGSPRLLAGIDFALLRRNPKPFVGYSDITALHLAITRYAGFVTFHGAMLNADLLGNKLEPTESGLWQMLSGQQSPVLEHPPAFALTTLAPGSASGRLLGGNLSMICATIGSAFELDDEGIILFIEDVNEPLYRVDRLLTHLRLAGKLNRLRGVLVGDFAGVDSVALHRLLQQELGPLGIPVLAGWRSGHCNPNLTLPLGAQVRLDADQQQLVLEQPVVT